MDAERRLKERLYALGQISASDIVTHRVRCGTEDILDTIITQLRPCALKDNGFSLSGEMIEFSLYASEAYNDVPLFIKLFTWRPVYKNKSSEPGSSSESPAPNPKAAKIYLSSLNTTIVNPTTIMIGKDQRRNEKSYWLRWARETEGFQMGEMASRAIGVSLSPDQSV